MARPTEIRIEGLRDLQREIRRLESRDLGRELRQANRDAANIVRDRARSNAPRRSGALARSVGTRAGQREAYVKAGTASRVPYAGVIHFGWPRRNIRPQPFLYRAVDERRAEVIATYEERLNALARRIDTTRR